MGSEPAGALSHSTAATPPGIRAGLFVIVQLEAGGMTGRTAQAIRITVFVLLAVTAIALGLATAID